MEQFAVFPTSAPFWIGVFVGIADWLARRTFRLWASAPFLLLLGVSVVAALTLLTASGQTPLQVAVVLGSYLMGLAAATGLYAALRWLTLAVRSRQRAYTGPVRQSRTR